MFVATDKNGEEWIYRYKPSRYNTMWNASNEETMKVPKGTIERLLNYPLTWDDDCQEIVEYKDSNILKEDKVIKQNIKMRVTPDQSRKVQEICFANGVHWVDGENVIQLDDQKYLYIDGGGIASGNSSECFERYDDEEIDADLFIKTNGSCEDTTLNDDDIIRILKASEDQPREHLKQKIVNLHDQLNKYRKTVQNQKKELTRLLSQKEDLQNRLNTANKTVGMSINNDIKLIRLLEEKDAIIKYLESKLEI